MSTPVSTVKPLFSASARLANVKPYALAGVFAAREEQHAQGTDVIDLGVGNPDLRPPDEAIRALEEALRDPAQNDHQYPPFAGLPEFREAVATWYGRRFGVAIEPRTEAIALGGSKEGIVKFLLAQLDPGDTLLVCSPCYPAYLSAVALAQAEAYEVPLTPRHGLRPDLGAIPTDMARRARGIVVNFPGNPTGGVETPAFYDELLRFAREHDLFVISDIAYCDLSLDPAYRTRSFLEFDRDRERTIEFHSCSKSYSMQGWRVAFAAGNRDAIATLARIKSNMDFGVFIPVQRAAIAVLTGPQDYPARAAATYRARRDAFLAALAPLGIPVEPPKAGIYVWLPIPRSEPHGGRSSVEFAASLLRATGVVVAPGTAFGAAGEGFVRVALCQPEERLREAAARIVASGFRW